MKITDLQDARALQRMGYPLDTPVEHRWFSAEYTRHWVAMMNAHLKFMRCVIKCSQSSTPAAWGKVQQRFDELIAVVQTSRPLKDDMELAILEEFKQGNAFPFLQYWADALAAVENGAELTIRPGDIPTWVES